MNDHNNDNRSSPRSSSSNKHCEELHRRHRLAFERITTALELDEAFKDDPNDRRMLIEIYESGIEELMAGIKINVDRIKDPQDHARAIGIKEKMKLNLSMANDRVQKLKSTLPAARKTTGLFRHVSAADVCDSTSSRSPSFVRTRASADSSAHWASAGSRPSVSAVRSTTSPSSVRPAATNKLNTSFDKLNLNGRTPITTRSKTASNQSSNARSVSKITTSSSSTKNKVNGTDRQASPSSELKEIGARVSNLRGINKELANTIIDHIYTPATKVTFDCIAGQTSAKQALYEMVILPTFRPELFTGLRSPARGLLLFGPPGNGKTLLAKAVASESKATFFNLSASALTSKWVGEAEKLVKALFAIARELQPSIIFIDEIDSLLCQRSSNEAESSRRLKTEFFIGFDGLQSSAEERIMVMGATNRPEELDDAILRRFTKRIYVKNPDFDTRIQLLKKLSEGTKCSLSVKDLRLLATQTEGYSGSDLAALAKDAALGPVRELSVDEIKNMPVSAMRTVNVDDFLVSSKRIRKSTPSNSVSNYENWNNQYGDVSR
ncbi:Spastin, partial [Fragariocoptes setiger]